MDQIEELLEDDGLRMKKRGENYPRLHDKEKKKTKTKTKQEEEEDKPEKEEEEGKT